MSVESVYISNRPLLNKSNQMSVSLLLVIGVRLTDATIE